MRSPSLALVVGLLLLAAVAALVVPATGAGDGMPTWGELSRALGALLAVGFLGLLAYMLTQERVSRRRPASLQPDRSPDGKAIH